MCDFCITLLIYEVDKNEGMPGLIFERVYFNSTSSRVAIFVFDLTHPPVSEAREGDEQKSHRCDVGFEV